MPAAKTRQGCPSSDSATLGDPDRPSGIPAGRLTTVCSYPDRGPWGDPGYRGNCSGHLIHQLLTYYQPRKVLDPMEGSGTTRQVCAEFNVPYVGNDLRDGEGLDLYSRAFTDWIEPERPIDFCFWHPPYGPMIRYSEHPRDISTVPIETFRKLLVVGAERLYRVLAPGGHLAVLMGIYRKKGQIHRFHLDLIDWKAPTEPELVKVQHNCHSDRTDYSDHARFIPILHEYVLIWRKPAGQEGGEHA